MIVKEKSSAPPGDRMARAGYDAEVQMAFYLRRAFADDRAIFVFNDLRLERGDEAAQIDHLVLHRFGFVLVESKSVHGRIQVNSFGEFMRDYQGKWQGMPSPIRQAHRQAELLRSLLNDHKESLRRKLLFGLQQGGFGEQRFRVLAAILDQGIIDRRGASPPELLKADAVCDAIRDVVARHSQTEGLIGAYRCAAATKEKQVEMEKYQIPPYTPDELDKLCAFLATRDAPLPPPRIVSAPPAAPPPPPRSLPYPPFVPPQPAAPLPAAAVAIGLAGARVGQAAALQTLRRTGRTDHARPLRLLLSMRRMSEKHVARRRLRRLRREEQNPQGQARLLPRLPRLRDRAQDVHEPRHVTLPLKSTTDDTVVPRMTTTNSFVGPSCET